MGRKKLSEIEKAQALTKIKMNVPVTKVAADLNISRQTVYTLLKATKDLPEVTVPKRKIGSGRKRKTTARTGSSFKARSAPQTINHTCNFEKEAPKTVGGSIHQNHPAWAFPAGV